MVSAAADDLWYAHGRGLVHLAIILKSKKMEKSLRTALARGVVVSGVMLLANRAANDLPAEEKFNRERRMLSILARMCEYYFSTARTNSEQEQLAIIAKQFSACAEAGLL